METQLFTTLFQLIIAVVFGGCVGWLIKRRGFSKMVLQTTDDSNRLLEETRKTAENIKKIAEIDAKEAIIKRQNEFDVKVKEKQKEIDKAEQRLLDREKTLDKKIERCEQKELSIGKKESHLDDVKNLYQEKNEEVKKLVEEQEKTLHRVSNMTAEQAKTELKEKFFEKARLESVHTLKRIEEDTLNEANEKARHLIASAIQRCASDYVAESTVSVLDIPSDEMKGRIIGREGRNIRAFEIATGVDLIIDDTPNAVVLSSFDMVKREIAGQTLSSLIKDGRIHPGRIEDTVAKISKEVNSGIKKDGERACFELGLDGIHPEIIKLLGRLKYRTSYSQNVLTHSTEVGFMCGMIAAELGQNVRMARRAGLLHDIGKAVDQSVEGSHTQIGYDLGRKYNEPKIVLNGIASHHEDVPAESVIAVLVAACDALSASRPGARREMLQTYINRMQKLEEIGDSFRGVEKTYAIQAGREVRVVVEPEAVGDSEAFFLAKDIARKIEDELAYPGEIKVTVIRETRVSEAAR
ncbi:MAG TPA: ribonuclease Y [Nitrospinota bacterium]|nr:ribonuclease Y [Nitrospinota bacterium]|tara:strand:- start:71546 stop:73114 length:1569 start_codon:yes stop_codon:yes gene_type:complete